MSQVALVTGASSGIGRAFCELLAEKGYDLVVVGRRADALGAVAGEGRSHGVTVEPVVADLTTRGGMETLAAAVARHPVELLVNSAGSGTFGPYLRADWDRTARMIDLNVAAYAGCLHLVARRMVEAGRGRIINIVSVAGFQPGPLMSAYYATKSYALSLSEALSVELAPRGVSVTALCPGPTSSPFHEAAGMTIPERDRRAMADAREIAAWGYRMARRGRHVAIHGAGFKTMVFLERFLPRRLVARMVGAMQRRRR